MGLRADSWITQQDGMIEPFVPHKVREVAGQGVISFGLSSYGYDIRVAPEFKVFRSANYSGIDSLSPVTLAWVAGIIDGEGCLTTSNGTRDSGKGASSGVSPRITVGMTHLPTLEQLQRITGVGHITKRNPEKRNPKHSDVWVWNVTRSRHVWDLLWKLLPYLITKKAEAYDLLHRSSLKDITKGLIVDPKSVEQWEDLYDDVEADHVDIPPNSFALARSVEFIRVPQDVLCLVIGKSTYARCGIVLNATPLEPGWCGYITLEISNTTPLPARIYAHEGIGQVLFYTGDEAPNRGYGAGKYQQQGPEIVLPRI